MDVTVRLVAVSLLPLYLVVYIGTIYTVLYPRYRDNSVSDAVVTKYFPTLYAPFAIGVGVVYAITIGLPPLTIHPIHTLCVPLGAGVYYVTSFLWRQYTGKPLRRGHADLSVNAPGLLAPFPEELLFRVGLTPLVGIIGTTGYLVYSSLLFGIFHFTDGGHEIVAKTGLGVVLGGLYLSLGSVVPAMLAHLGYNLAWLLFVTGRVP